MRHHLETCASFTSLGGRFSWDSNCAATCNPLSTDVSFELSACQEIPIERALQRAPSNSQDNVDTVQAENDSKDVLVEKALQRALSNSENNLHFVQAESSKETSVERGLQVAAQFESQENRPPSDVNDAQVSK
jgi:hypothetical protein